MSKYISNTVILTSGQRYVNRIYFMPLGAPEFGGQLSPRANEGRGFMDQTLLLGPEVLANTSNIAVPPLQYGHSIIYPRYTSKS